MIVAKATNALESSIPIRRLEREKESKQGPRRGFVLPEAGAARASPRPSESLIGIFRPPDGEQRLVADDGSQHLLSGKTGGRGASCSPASHREQCVARAAEESHEPGNQGCGLCFDRNQSSSDSTPHFGQRDEAAGVEHSRRLCCTRRSAQQTHSKLTENKSANRSSTGCTRRGRSRRA